MIGKWAISRTSTKNLKTNSVNKLAVKKRYFLREIIIACMHDWAKQSLNVYKKRKIHRGET